MAQQAPLVGLLEPLVGLPEPPLEQQMQLVRRTRLGVQTRRVPMPMQEQARERLQRKRRRIVHTSCLRVGLVDRLLRPSSTPTAN